MQIGERIKRRREELGLSADQVADRIGKNRATVYRYESNDIKNFPIEVLTPLAEVLRTTPAYLMGWDTPAETEVQETPAYNVLRIAARDGSYREKRLSDDDLAAVLVLVDRLPDASEDL